MKNLIILLLLSLVFSLPDEDIVMPPVKTLNDLGNDLTNCIFRISQNSN